MMNEGLDFRYLHQCLWFGTHVLSSIKYNGTSMLWMRYIYSFFPKAYAEKVRHCCSALGFGSNVEPGQLVPPRWTVQRYNTSGHPNGLGSMHVSNLEAVHIVVVGPKQLFWCQRNLAWAYQDTHILLRSEAGSSGLDHGLVCWGQ
ncbi:hypothetical protein VNO78_15525 [Psophocarpus tetragonolobus]|uniref:Uncharacterized protein n=1 Tax=Psophocarpus tetragonolobus TaxID=3891 RepID=A0AAN9SG84_PSOTE